MSDFEKTSWPLERVLFALAGSVTISAAVLGIVVSKWFMLLAGVVGINQWLYVLTGSCPASLLLRRGCRLESVLYDNNSNGAQARAQEVAVR